MASTRTSHPWGGLRGPLFLTALLVAATADAEIVLLPGGKESTWRFRDDGVAPPDAWRKATFDDSSWKQGVAPLGYGERDLGTVLEFGEDSEKKPITVYFRTRVELPAERLGEIADLRLRLRRDDGAIVWWNGKEIARSNLPTGEIRSETTASRALGGDEETRRVELYVSTEGLRLAKENVLAVEVHQASSASSDLCLDLEVVGLRAGEAPKRDPYRDGMQAASSRNWTEAAELLAKVPPSHPRYARAMALLGHRVHALALGQPKEGLPWVKRAYDAAPQDRSVLQSYLRVGVLSGEWFDDADLVRERRKDVLPEHAFLVTKPAWDDPSEKIAPEKLAQDLDWLEHILVHCFAYLKIQDVDYRAALDAIRASLDENTTRNLFQLQIAKLISLFGDGHARVAEPASRWMPSGYAPFVADDYAGRIWLYDPRTSKLLDAEHPWVKAIDGRPIEEWLRVAGYPVVKQSRQWHRRGALENLSFVNYVRAELGLPQDTTLRIELESDDGESTRGLEVEVGKKPLRRLRFPRGESRRIGDVGYLRIPSMTSNPRFVAGLESWMDKFRDTKGLIIDLRGNTGGSKTILWALFPYFMKPDAPLRILELSVFRKPIELPQPPLGGYMRSDTSGQPITSKRWTSDAQRQLIREFLDGYRTEWLLPEGEFSEWHVMALDASQNPQAYYYDQPLTILQDESSFSASDIFLGAFEDHPNTTLLGTPSGGGNGWMEGFALPNSGVQVVLCQSAKFRPNGKLYDSVGLAPDIFLEATPADILGESDSVLDAAVERLQAD